MKTKEQKRKEAAERAEKILKYQFGLSEHLRNHLFVNAALSRYYEATKKDWINPNA